MSGIEEAASTWKAPEQTVSDRIRALARAGHSRAEIAKLLGKRYQHVRNVLEADKLKATPAPSPAKAPRSSRSLFPARMIVGADGRLEVPQEALRALGAGPGDVLIGTFRDGDFRLTDPVTSARRVRARIMASDKGAGSAVDELIAERRAEAAREDAEAAWPTHG